MAAFVPDLFNPLIIKGKSDLNLPFLLSYVFDCILSTASPTVVVSLLGRPLPPLI